MHYKQFLQVLGVDEELVMMFFLVFSRFEFALKKAGYLKKRSRKAQPNWEDFADEYKDKFKPESKPELKKAWDYIRHEPPRRQVVLDGELDFEPDPKFDSEKSPFRKAVLAVNAVRNNLFHGGKFHYAEIVEDPVRNPDLLQACLVLLREMLDLAPDVKREYKSLECYSLN